MHRGREDSKAKAQATAKANSLVECQPNTGAPLLRDEKARRDWVERELDICCQVTPCHIGFSLGSELGKSCPTQ